MTDKEDDIYVVVAEHDGTNYERGPMISATMYATTANKEYMEKIADDLRAGNKYGKCRIARLVFVDGEE